ncbi:hypothetical protein MPRG_24150 [Mycobacterium paragordonae]|uniref:Uncharacterized protein n=1 Tax=Mycobacterium paragordonae TaxID=1389713 RepID=A0ABQ1C400_9MYCO|nr:hypothetical protein MPRG_24150 [Mycobacterium paragordonae]
MLITTEAIELFQHYYDHRAVPTGWHLREHAEFTTPAAGDVAYRKPTAVVSQQSPTASPLSAEARNAYPADATADNPKWTRKQSGDGKWSRCIQADVVRHFRH